MQTGTLIARGLKPAAELAQARPHGERLRYIGGCRCNDCRRANTEYEKARVVARKQGDWNGIVPADKARQHIAELSRAGVGRRTISFVSGVANTALSQISAGTKIRIRARSERAILSVTSAAAADHALVCAKSTWVLLNELLSDGYSKAQLARALGNKTPALQIGKRFVTVRTAYQVQLLHSRLCYSDATTAVAQLEELHDEGFHRRRVERLLTDLAHRHAMPEPLLEVRSGRMHAATARLICILYDQLMS